MNSPAACGTKTVATPSPSIIPADFTGFLTNSVINPVNSVKKFFAARPAENFPSFVSSGHCFLILSNTALLNFWGFLQKYYLYSGCLYLFQS